MAIGEYASYDGLALGELVRKGEVTALELLDEAIARVEKLNPKLNAIVYKFYDMAREAARDRSPGNAPFEGVPFLLKDIFGDLAGVPTRSASRYVPNVPMPVDSELVARYKRAGLIPFAKTNVPEFGLVPTTESQLYGPAHNPWNLAHTTGGSSGGSAAAVAAGIVPLAHANDGGGSIRIPAAACGLVGLKPTRARNSLAPLAGDLMNGLIVEHVVTRTVRDSAAALDATAGSVPGDPYVAPPPTRPWLEEVTARPERLRIAFYTRAMDGSLVHSDSVEAVQHAAKIAADLGHEVTEDVPEFNLAQLMPDFTVVWTASAAVSVEGVRRITGRKPERDLFESLTWNLYELGKGITAAQYLLAINGLQRFSHGFARFFEKYDLWLTPTLGTPPFKLGAVDLKGPTANMFDETIVKFAHLNPLYNVTGQPAITLPLYWNKEGLPLGVTFGARLGDEAALFRIAGQMEQAAPWKDRRPPVWG